MSSKEIKSRLKAAKAAVDDKDYEKTLKQCQVGVIVRHQAREIGVHYLEYHPYSLSIQHLFHIHYVCSIYFKLIHLTTTVKCLQAWPACSWGSMKSQSDTIREQ